MSVFQGHIQQKQISGRFPPGPPPSPVRMGRTLYVSSLGNNATATRQDIVFHYLTLDAALTAAIAGDLIIMHPGFYTCSNALGLSVVDSLTIYANPGVNISGSIFKGFKTGFKLTGHADITCDNGSPQSLSSRIGVTGLIYIECNSITSIGGLNNYTGGDLIMNIAKSLTVTTTDVDGITFYDNGNALHAITNFYLSCPLVTFNVYGFNCYGWRNSDLKENSYVKIVVNKLVSNLYNLATLYVNTPTLASMGWTVIFIGDIYNYSNSSNSYCIKAGRNNDWIESSALNYGFYSFGSLICNDMAAAIYLVGGRLQHQGNIIGNLCENLCNLTHTTSFGDMPSILFLIDGYAKKIEPGGAIVYYNTVECMVQFKNYKAISRAFLVDANDAFQTYQVLSVYSQTDVSTNVTNEIASTTAIIDPLINN